VIGITMLVILYYVRERLLLVVHQMPSVSQCGVGARDGGGGAGNY
jgi:hypothetical protein